jgi:hypothetical protein
LQSRVLFYTTDQGNISSQRAAKRLGLQLRGARADFVGALCNMVGTFTVASSAACRLAPTADNGGAQGGAYYASVLAITIAGSTVTRTVAAGTEPSGKVTAQIFL